MIRRKLIRLVSKVSSSRLDPGMSASELRETVEAATRGARLPVGTTVESAVADGVFAEWITPRDSASGNTILYIHGGGWILGLNNTHRRMIALMCKRASCRALAVHHRLAPEAPFPAALDDCLTAYRWLVARGAEPSRIVTVGDSSGGNLVLATLIALRDAGDQLPAGAVCQSPVTDLAGTGDTFDTTTDVLLTTERARMMIGAYAGGHDLRLPLMSPHYADLTGLPPLLVQVGGDEILLSDSVRLAERARAAGVEVRLSEFRGMWHGWQAFAPWLPEAARAFDEAGAYVRERFPS